MGRHDPDFEAPIRILRGLGRNPDYAGASQERRTW